jgi:hypothetical protein
MKTTASVLGIALLALAALAPAHAGIYTISDGNSTASVDTSSQSGMFNWTVDGISSLFQQWFWYRVGPTSGESSIDTLTEITAGTSNGNLDPAHERLNVLYAGAGFTIGVDFLMAGGSPGSGVADIAEIIRIQNTSNQALDFHFFQYVDFDLGGTASGDTGERVNANTMLQYEGSASVSETVAVPTPSHYEVATYPTILLSLTDGSPTTLADAAGPVSGDVSWAFQWDFTLVPGGTYIISKDKHLIVPEPSTCVLMMLSGLGLVALLRKRGA